MQEITKTICIMQDKMYIEYDVFVRSIPKSVNIEIKRPKPNKDSEKKQNKSKKLENE